MKAKYISILTAIAATAALVSCSKEFSPDKPDAGQPGETLRTITVSFDTPTKSYLYEMGDGILQPLFSEDDSILVSNGIKLDTCRVFPKKTGVVSLKQPMAILTKLEGPLKAVYPYTAALCEGNTITGTKVPSEQSGSFADANICMANQSGVEDESLVFSTDVAILRFYTKGFEVDSIRIKSGSNPIAFDKENQITLVPKQQKVDNQAVAQQEMGKQVLTIEPDYWYAAIDVKQGNVAGKDLTFESVTHTQDTTVVKQSTSEVKLSANTMYNVFIPYYIKVNVGSVDEPEFQYWAYCNIGSFTPDDQGEYFMWGEVKGHRVPTDGGYWNTDYAFKYDFSTFPFSAYKDRYLNPNAEKGFGISNAPYYNGSSYTKYDSSLSTLRSEDDAATANWGEGWRMPTRKEFEDLLKLGHTYGSQGIIEFNDNPLILYFAGTGKEYALSGGWDTHYWSSSIDEKGQAYATALATSKNTVTAVDRWYGCSIRPIYDPAPKSQSFTMTITPYTSGGTL